MASLLPIHRLLLLLAFTSSTYAYSNNLWYKDFDTFHKWKIIQENEDCNKAYQELNSQRNNSMATALIDCILTQTSEVTKAEFGVVTVMLGLLPGVLQLIGPKFSDLSHLATRRPLLALFLTLGSPCPALDYETTGMESYLQTSSPPYWPGWLRKRRTWVTVLVAVVEYLMVMGAAGNVVYQFYRLTFYAVVMISVKLGQYGGTLEAFAPLLWVFLGVPIHGLGVLQFYLCRVGGEEGSSTKRRDNKSLAGVLKREFTPCAFAGDVGEEVVLENGPVFQMLNWGIRLCIWTDVIYGIIVLSTVLFVPMWSAIWMIGLIFTGTLFCRLVLEFEMYGLREVPKVEGKGLQRSLEDHEMARLMPEGGKGSAREAKAHLLQS